MPKISKCRIANVYYNNGTRMIPDNIYDFSGGAGFNKILNTLITMNNGIGKTVLSQLMLQPILPKSSIAGRKITEYFERPGRHSYVAFEWILDGSDDRLLTGISIAASDTQGQPDGKNSSDIKYYTFLSHYRGSSKYDIVSLDFSYKENGNFKAAPYEYVRTLAKGSGGKLLCYSSDEDDKKEWNRTLYEYGIITNEWQNIILKLNEDENGMSAFFKGIKRSDSLIDKLLIPAIEGRNGNDLQGTAELVEMIIRYARKYDEKEKTIREQEENKAVNADFKNTADLASKVWDSRDYYLKALAQCYGFKTALDGHEDGLSLLIGDYERKAGELEDRKRRILWEQDSASYYEKESRFKEFENKWKESEDEESKTDKTLKNTEHEIEVLGCARYFNAKRDAEIAISAINEQIRALAEDSELSGRINSLGAAIYGMISREMPPLREKQDNTRDNIREYDSCLQNGIKELQGINDELKKVNDREIRNKALLDRQVDYTDKYIEKLGITASRLLFGGFDKEELKKERKGKESEKTVFEGSLTEKTEERKKIEQRKDGIPQLLADKNSQRERVFTCSEKIKADIGEYEKLAAKIEQHYIKYGYDYNERWNGALEDYLEGEIGKLDRESDESDTEIRKINRQLTAISDGSLHIFREAIDYLEESGVNYQTCEKYLLELLRTGAVTQDDISRLLEAYPVLAYSIIMEDKEKAGLPLAGNKWLSSSVPLITNAQLEKCLKGNVPGTVGEPDEWLGNHIALYSQTYFEDSAGFSGKLEKRKQNLQERIEINKRDIENLRGIINEVRGFTGEYPPDWLKGKQDELETLDAQYSALSGEIKELGNEKGLCTAKLESLSNEIENIKGYIRGCEEWLKLFEEMLDSIKEEEKYYASSEDCRNKKKELGKRQKAAITSNEQCGDKLKKLRDTEQELSVAITNMEEALLKVGSDYPSDTEVQEDGTWEELYKVYTELTESQGKSIDILNTKLENHKTRKKEAEDGLSGYGHIPEEEYKDIVYDKEKENGLREKRRMLNTLLDELSRRNKDLSREYGEAKAKFDEQKDKLRKYTPAGMPLEKAEIGTDFKGRLDAAETEMQSINKKIRETQAIYKNVQKLAGRVGAYMDNLESVESAEVVILDKENPGQQWEVLSNSERACKKQRESLNSNLSSKLGDLTRKYDRSEFDYISKSIKQIKRLFDSDMPGDKIYTIIEQLNGFMHNTELRINMINAELTDFEKSKADLVRQCTYQGRRMYEGLVKMQKASNIRIMESMPKKQILRLDIPKEVDENVSLFNIEREIDSELPALLDKIKDPNLNDDKTKNDKINRAAARIVSSANLLRKYIGMENIRLEAYKIDKNVDNCGYRTWEKTQVQNSGAEKFLVYFTVILGIITFYRSEHYDMASKDMSSALILDNPFGPITSPHVLKPMFLIAKQFNVQLICLSDIDKSDVIERFDIRINGRLKKLSMSGREYLTHEGNEKLEHGFYKSEQMGFL